MVDLRAGSVVVAPTPKAMKSVTEVMVMATPACESAALILSGTANFCSFTVRVLIEHGVKMRSINR